MHRGVIFFLSFYYENGKNEITVNSFKSSHFNNKHHSQTRRKCFRYFVRFLLHKDKFYFFSVWINFIFHLKQLFSVTLRQVMIPNNMKRFLGCLCQFLNDKWTSWHLKLKYLWSRLTVKQRHNVFKLTNGVEFKLFSLCM